MDHSRNWICASGLLLMGFLVVASLGCSNDDVEREAAAIVQAAQADADRIRAEARDDAEQMIADAEAEVARLMQTVPLLDRPASVWVALHDEDKRQALEDTGAVTQMHARIVEKVGPERAPDIEELYAQCSQDVELCVSDKAEDSRDWTIRDLIWATSGYFAWDGE